MYWLFGPRTEDLLAYDVCHEEVKFILNSVLALCHFLWSLARLGLHEFTVASPLRFGPRHAHFARQLAAVG